ncbi:hypothetical protein JCM5353_008653 [Sporobolomyces roseus]
MADSETYHPGKAGADTINEGAPEANFYLPRTTPSTGTTLSSDDWPQNEKIPKLFEAITIKGMEFKNRIFVSPMCQYSAEAEGDRAGAVTNWHTVHLGQFAQRGAACVMVEATSVLPNGRISPQDLGLWNDTQRDALKGVFDIIRSLGSRPAIQLAHAGRKASTLAPWLDTSTIKAPLKSHVATNGDSSGWTDNVWAPSALSYDDDTFPMPKAMTEEDIEELKKAWKDATIRVDQAGADVIEVHAAHGYLVHEFLSPVSNKRTDKYGGSLENRMRLPLEIVDIVRENWPQHKPLFVRISASDWYPDGEKNEQGEYISWGIEQSKIFLKEVEKRGVDLMDASSGGLTPKQKIDVGPSYQVPFAEALKAEASIPISAVGLITSGKQAEEILQKGQADILTVARHFLRDPSLVLNWAQELDTVVNVPVQYQRSYTRMYQKPEDKK